MRFSFLALPTLLLMVLACAGENGADQGATPSPSPTLGEGPRLGQAVRVAFIGDQGLGENARAVLQLIEDEGAEMVLHQGDFEYQDNPRAWGTQIDEVLGPDFPYFASAGNHDECCIQGYREIMQARLERVPGASCEGELIVQATCTYRGLFMVFVAPDVAGSGHEAYIRDQLARADSVWRICSWHKVMQEMNVGRKEDESGWGVYEACREGGGIVATGHEHSYGRTHLMSNFETQEVASTSSTLVLDEGKTFAFHSGLGGESIRDQEREGEWWASVYTSDQGANYGALFCTFFDGRENHASCYFKDIDGRVVDQFELVSEVGSGP